MRRDMDIIRSLLLQLEELEQPHGYCGVTAYGDSADVKFDGATSDDIDAHMGMLYDADYIGSGTDVRGPRAEDIGTLRR